MLYLVLIWNHVDRICIIWVLTAFVSIVRSVTKSWVGLFTLQPDLRSQTSFTSINGTESCVRVNLCTSATDLCQTWLLCHSPQGWDSSLIPTSRPRLRASLPNASLPTFSACQFAECQSAYFESLVRASLSTESMITTLSLTPLNTDHYLKRLLTDEGNRWDRGDCWIVISCQIITHTHTKSLTGHSCQKYYTTA